LLSDSNSLILYLSELKSWEIKSNLMGQNIDADIVFESDIIEQYAECQSLNKKENDFQSRLVWKTNLFLAFSITLTLLIFPLFLQLTKRINMENKNTNSSKSNSTLLPKKPTPPKITQIHEGFIKTPVKSNK
jgi:hypothetical protein